MLIVRDFCGKLCHDVYILFPFSLSQSEELFKRRILKVYIIFLKSRDKDWFIKSLLKSTFKQKAIWRGLRKQYVKWCAGTYLTIARPSSLKKKKYLKDLICSIFQLPLCKYSYCGRCQVANMKFLNTELQISAISFHEP